MEIKLFLYVLFTFLSAFGLTAINFNNIIKNNKYIEVRVLVMVLSFALGYLLTNFVIDFLNV